MVRFISLIGIVDLFGDTTYSGGAAINGMFLASLGASAAAISITGGASEFLNYLTRGLSGFIADRIKNHWSIVFTGYIFNLLAVPAIALTGHWQAAALLILIQGLGRGARKPVIQSMLSFTTGVYGRGWVYGLHTALDYTGRALGPLVIAITLLFTDKFRTGYGLLLIPALLAFVFLTLARVNYPFPSRLELKRSATKTGFTKAYWYYYAAGIFFAAGLTNFELISFHLSESGIAHQTVPFFLVLSTASGGIVSLFLGRLYDKKGHSVVLAAVFLSALFSPFIFLFPANFAIAGILLWGVGQVTQDMLLSSVVASELPRDHRSLAFGLYYTGYGFGWLLGSIATGLLYEQSRLALVAFAAGTQILSLPFFVLGHRRSMRGGRVIR